MPNMFPRFIHFLQFLYGTIAGRTDFYKNVHKWFSIDGNSRYLTQYPLTKDSIVFEVGGYKGIFTDIILEKYHCNQYIFEPIVEYYDILVTKYKDYDNVKVYNFGLGKENSTIELGLLDDGTSAYKEGKKELVTIKKMSDFLDENSINTIDLVSINIEGGEYDLIEDIIDSGKIIIMKNIQIQFHDFVHNAGALRNSCIDKILLTHKKTYSFPFVWEGFEKR